MVKNEPVIRPGAIVLTLVLMGISTLFGGICAAYLYTLFTNGTSAPPPPLLFIMNIPVLLGATQCLRKSRLATERGDQAKHERLVLFCLILSIVFISIQVLGWKMFFAQIPLSATQARSFLFVLSGLHLLHVIAGLPFLIRYIRMNKGDFNLLRFPSAYRYRFLTGLIRYWRYLDILWILLVVILSFGYALKWL